MKKRALTILCAAFFCLFLSETGSGLPTDLDLKLKQEIYFRLGKPDAQAGAPGKPLKVKKSQLVTCRQGMCAALIARVLKSPSQYKVNPPIKIKNLTTGEENEGMYDFPSGLSSKDFSLFIPLQDGENLVRIELDWSKRYPETDETNNVLEVPVLLIVDI